MMLLPVWLPAPMFLPDGGLRLWSHVPSRGSLSGSPDRNSPWTENPRQKPPGQRTLDGDPQDRDLLDREPSYGPPPLPDGKERAICILLECILVFYVFILKAGNITKKSTMVYRTYHGELRNVSDFATAEKVIIILYQYRH